MRALLIFADLRLLSIFQKIAWKAGHKKVCVPNEATSQNEVASPKAATLLELRLLQKINTHYEARDWRGVVELEGEAVAVATALRGRTPMLAADIYHALGVSLQYLRNPRATMMHWEQKAIGECMGDSAVVARACVNLGGCLQSSKEYKQGIKVLQQAKAIAEEKGEKRLAGLAACNLGNCFQSLGSYESAIAMHQEHMAILESQGESVGAACNNIGVCYKNMGSYEAAIAMFLRSQRTLKAEAGNQTGYDQDVLGTTSGNLAECYLCTSEYQKAILSYKDQYAISTHPQMQSRAALGLGVALRLQVLGERKGALGESLSIGDGAALAASPAALASSGAVISTAVLSSSRAVGAAGVDGRDARKWLYIALAGGEHLAQLHLAHLAFDVGQEDEACTLLGKYLSWRVNLGRNMCLGCEQARGDDSPMLACSGCNVARFCNSNCQKQASKSAMSGKSVLWERHKEICGLIGKWHHVVIKNKVPHASLAPDLLEFLKG
jgi:tetratricopeptide (TPR) repeat protein